MLTASVTMVVATESSWQSRRRGGPAPVARIRARRRYKPQPRVEAPQGSLRVAPRSISSSSRGLKPRKSTDQSKVPSAAYARSSAKRAGRTTTISCPGMHAIRPRAQHQHIPTLGSIHFAERPRLPPGVVPVHDTIVAGSEVMDVDVVAQHASTLEESIKPHKRLRRRALVGVKPRDPARGVEDRERPSVQALHCSRRHELAWPLASRSRARTWACLRGRRHGASWSARRGRRSARPLGQRQRYVPERCLMGRRRCRCRWERGRYRRRAGLMAADHPPNVRGRPSARPGWDERARRPEDAAEVARRRGIGAAESRGGRCESRLDR